jgi:tRNA nucleotidyltransferase (CCA-adding enzyme)
MKLYTVGGAVRDSLLGITPKDFDYLVVGATPDEMIANGFTQVGADFPVFLRNGVEYALARKDRKIGPGYNGFETVFDTSVTVEEDLSRRDLTINSIAYDAEDDTYIDPFNGIVDIDNKILRHTSSAFSEDPLRVLRVARFAARYSDFTIHPSTLILLQEVVLSEELLHISKERVWVEFEKAFSDNNPGIFIKVLFECGALNQLFPDIGIDLSTARSIAQFVNDMSAAHTVAERFAVMVWYLSSDTINSICDANRVPNDVRRFCLSYSMFVKKLFLYQACHTNDRAWMITALLQDMMQFGAVVRCIELLKRQETAYIKVNEYLQDVELALEIFTSITFASLPLLLQQKLKGASVGAAITTMRSAAIQIALENNVTL